jgi:citrate synthase
MDGMNNGLEGVVVAETRLSDVDGARGRLVLRGHAVEELAHTATFEDVCALFLDVTPAQARERLGAARVAAHARLPAYSDDVEPMDALRAALARPGPDDVWSCIAEVALVTSQLASKRRAPLAPDARAAHAHDVLRMSGVDTSDAHVRALDAYFVTVVDHGMNASTFAARVVASMGSDLRSCVVAGIGALKGPLHGGAPGPVLDMLDAIASTPDVPPSEWLLRELAAGRRIMGMGHRVYRVRDPRAEVLERVCASLQGARLELGRVVEREAERLLAERHPGRALKANVELFTALLLDALGFARASFTSLFACARVVGWCAHVGEQRQTGRLIRPASRYVG